MSAISDVGVNFKMTGAGDFESRLRSLETQWKSFSDSMNKAPEVNQHFDKIGRAAEQLSKRVSNAMALTKAAIAAVITAKVGSGAFNWAIGSEELSDSRLNAKINIAADVLKQYESQMAGIRKEFKATKAELYESTYQIGSALAGKPMEQQLQTFRDMGYYSTMLRMNMKDASVFYKGLWASFGQFLSPEKQKTFSEDTLGMLHYVGRETMADPKEIAQAISQASSVYSQYKVPESRMMAELAGLVAVLHSPERAGVGLRNIYSRQSDIVSKLAEAAYQNDYLHGRVQGTYRDWGKMRDLKWQAQHGMDPRQRQIAAHDLAEMKANAPYYGDVMAEKAESALRSGNLDSLWKILNPLIDKLQNEKGGLKALEKAVGTELIQPILALSKLYKEGTIQNYETGMKNLPGSLTKKIIDEQKETELPHLWELVKQGAEDLSASLRSIFYEPMKALLEEWKGVFGNLEKEFAGKGGLERLKEFAAGGSRGLIEGWNNGKAVAEDNRSIGQMFQEFVSSLNAEDWRTAGQKIGKAATDFVTVISQLKEMINAAYGAYQKLTEGGGEKRSVLPGFAGAWTGWKALSRFGWLPGLVGAAGGFMGGDVLVNGAPKTNKYAEQYGGFGIPFLQGNEQPQPLSVAPRISSGESIPRLQLPSGGDQPVSGNFQGEFKVGNVTFNVDGKQIAIAVVPDVVDEVMGIIEGELDRSRGNANDKPFMGQ